MDTPDSEHNEESETEVEITDLDAPYSPPVPATQLIPTLAGNLVLMPLQDGNVTTLSASTGSLRWHHYVDG